MNLVRMCISQACWKSYFCHATIRSCKGKVIRAIKDSLLKLVLEDFITAVLRELYIVMAGVHTRTLFIWWHIAQGMISDTIDWHLIFQVAEAALGQAFATRQPLDKLWSKVRFHLNDKAQEVIVASALCREAVVGLDRLLKLPDVFPIRIIWNLSTDHVLHFELGIKGSDAIQR